MDGRLLSTPSALPVDVVVPAWGAYLATLPEAVASAWGAHVIAVVDPEAVPEVERLGCTTIPRPPGGVAEARQAGLSAGRHPFVLFLDADDRLLPGALSRLHARLARAPARVIAVTGRLRRRSDGSHWPPTGKARVTCLPGGGPLLLRQNVLPSVGACLIRRAALPPGVLFPDCEDEDWHAIVRLRAHGAVRFANEEALDYADVAGTLSRRPRDRGALAASRTRLIDAAAGARCWWWWRTVDRVVARHRACRDEQLIDRWGAA